MVICSDWCENMKLLPEGVSALNLYEFLINKLKGRLTNSLSVGLPLVPQRPVTSEEKNELLGEDSSPVKGFSIFEIALGSRRRSTVTTFHQPLQTLTGIKRKADGNLNQQEGEPSLCVSPSPES